MEKLHHKTFWRWFTPAAILFIAGLVLAGFFDLSLDLALYNPKSVFAITMEAFGWYPTFLPAVLFFLMLIPRKHDTDPRRWKTLLGVALSLGGMVGICLYSYSELSHRGVVRGMADPRTWMLAGFVAALYLALLLFARFMPQSIWPRMRFFAICGMLYLAANQIVVNLVKTLWQRTRFDDMLALGNFGDFTNWFAPIGMGGSSLPSAHTANAAGVLLLVVLCDLFPAWDTKRPLVYVASWFYIALMGVSRIVIGRHFLSDVLMGAALAAVIFFVLRHSVFYKRAAGKLRQDAEASP